MTATTRRPKKTIPEPFPADAARWDTINATLRRLRADYQADVEALALILKPRLVSGEFSGILMLGAEVPIWAREHPRFSDLEALCKDHPRAASPGVARLTLGLVSERTISAAQASGVADFEDERGSAAFCLAYDVRQIAMSRWGLADDGWFKAAA